MINFSLSIYFTLHRMVLLTAGRLCHNFAFTILIKMSLTSLPMDVAEEKDEIITIVNSKNPSFLPIEIADDNNHREPVISRNSSGIWEILEIRA